MAAVVFACLSALLFGALTVAIRIALPRVNGAEVAALASAAVALGVTAAIAVLTIPSDRHFQVADLWPFLAAGVLAPGLSQLFFVQAVRDIGASRTSVLVGCAPLVSVVIALVALHEPLRALLIVGAVLIVVGSLALAGERVRPAEFRSLGMIFALASTVMFSTRDNFLRWLAVGARPPALVTAPVAMAGGAATLLAYLLLRHAELRGLGRALRVFLVPGLLFGVSYSLLFEAYYRGRVTVVSPLVASESLWGVVFASLLLRRSELISRHVVVGAVLVVAGGVLIGATR
jgi:drug/metabolite transporter (DMT)-like permease